MLIDSYYVLDSIGDRDVCGCGFKKKRKGIEFERVVEDWTIQ
jgi:hypothetical protein